MALVNWSMRAQGINVAQWLLQDDLVKKEQRVEGLVLGASGDIVLEGQIGQEFLQFLLAGELRWDLAQGFHVTAKP